MTEPVPSSVAVKRRQYLLLAGVGAVIVIGTATASEAFAASRHAATASEARSRIPTFACISFKPRIEMGAIS